MARATCRVDRPFTRLTFSLAAYRRLAPKGQPIHPINREETGRNLAPSIFSFFFLHQFIHAYFLSFFGFVTCKNNIVKEGNFCWKYSLLIKNKLIERWIMNRRDRMNRLHNKFNLAFSIAFIYYIEFHVKYSIEEIYGDRISQVDNLEISYWLDETCRIFERMKFGKEYIGWRRTERAPWGDLWRFRRPNFDHVMRSVH